MSESGKKKYRFNFIDVIILLIIFAIIAMVVVFFVLPGSDSPIRNESVEIEYVIKVSQINEELKDLIKVGDEVTENTGLSSIGSVKDVKYTESVYNTVNKKTGENVQQNYPGAVDVVITVSAKAQINTGIYKVDGYTVSPGINISFRVPGYTGSGVCESVSEVG